MKFLDSLLGRGAGREEAGSGRLRQVAHSPLPPSFDAPRRTEDIRFSPSGRILAAVATNGHLFLFALDPSRRPVEIARHAVVTSPVLLSPHGVDFLDEQTVVVANRGGWVTFFRLPAPEAWSEEMALPPIHEMHSRWFGAKGETRKLGKRTIVCGPGSVRVRGGELLIVCNKTGSVTTHPFRHRDDSIETDEGELFARDDIGLPDGVAVSRDGRWIAVSDHANCSIAIYHAADRTRIATLRDPGLAHPHGLCFNLEGDSLHVADAGGRTLHVFTTTNGWSSDLNRSSERLTAVDEAAFRKTHESIAKEFRPLEGGIKGIDLDPSGRLLATTCQNQILRFFEIVR